MDEWVGVLPHWQAGFNTTAVILMVAAYGQVRAGRREAHRALMLGAVGVSVLFLISYLIYHGAVGNVKFAGQGGIRPVYFTILATHVILAAVMLPLILMTLWRALRGEVERHRALARWTLPIWLYVSVTGVLIYWMAFHLHPSTA